MMIRFIASVMSPLVAVLLCAGLAPSILKAEAPALYAPPVFSEARLWLDASDDSTFTTDAQGGVLSWADKSGNGNDAETYDGATLGVVGLTNGVPAFLMGDTGTGIDLKFPRMADIRSVFWVMDVSRKTEAVFLADSTKNYQSHDFLRTDDAVFKWDCKAFTGDLWFDDMWLYSWSMKRWSVKDGHLPAGTAVYSLSCGTDLTADRLSWPKDASAAYSGGRALSELVVFNRMLSVEEVLQVKSYLKAKWKGVLPVTVAESVTPAEVTGYGDLILGEGASFILTDASLGFSSVAAVNVWGSFDMTEAGKIRLDYRGHVWRRSQALFHVGQGGLKLDDFELTGLPAGASVTCDGKTLMMTVGGDLPVPKVLAAGENGPRLWLDASRGDAFVTNAAGGVLRWKDRSGCCNDATNYPYGHWYYPVTGVTNGVPALLMGDAQSGMDLAFPKMDDIRTVFWAMDIADSNYASFLGSFAPDDDQWNQKGQAYQRSGNYRSTGRFGYFLYSLPSQVYQGEMREDGAPAKSETDTELRWISPGKGMHIYSHRVKDDVPAWANNLGRCGNVNYLSGGKAISELIIFNRSLSDDDRAAVENYQLAKWGKPAAKITTLRAVANPCSFASLTVDRATGNAQSYTTTGSFSVDAAALRADRPLIRIMGELRRGNVSSIEFVNAGDMPEAGTYKLLECASRFNCGDDDFVFSGFPQNARFYWEDNALFIRILERPAPLVPRVLAATGESAPWLWLDASDAETFTTNAQGGVTRWADKGARGNDATAYQLGDVQRYGTFGLTNGVSAFLMGVTGSGIDLAFPRTTTARTMFWVMDIAQHANAWFLGDETSVNFQRGKETQYSYYGNDQTGFKSGVVRENGSSPHTGYNEPWRDRPYDPGATHVYSLQAAADMAASRLSADRDSVAVNGGRALSELVVFNRALTTAEVNDVEAYLTLKWRNKKVTLSAAVDATARVSYPDLNCGDGAAFTVDSSALEVGGEAAVTVYGFCERIGGGRIVITDVARRTRPGLVLFRCAGSYAISLDSFEFAGFPKGTTFAWENNELKVVDCPPAGLRVFVR